MTTTSVSQSTTYRSVAILRPGTFTDANGRSVSFTEDSLQCIADNYDPAYHCAVLNLDHNESGPAQGFVSDLVWDGAHLLADLSGVPAELAQAVGAGCYPFRSAEVYADLDGRGPYLRAVALLGARPPAVKGLPPMPQAECSCQLPVGSCQQDQCTPARNAYQSGLTTDSWQLPTPAMHLRSNEPATARHPAAHQPHIITVFMEVPMSVNEFEPAAELTEAGSTQAQSASPLDTIRLAEENTRLRADTLRLAEENCALKATERQREVRYFLAELRAAGQLTPALERAGVEQALIAAGEQPLSVNLPAGGTVALADLLRQLLKAMPVSVSFGETAPATAPAAPVLSADDQAVMAALGLSAEEYARR